MQKKLLIGFGEIMARLCPQGHLRFRQTMPGNLNLTFAGAEANVLVTNAIFGQPTRYATALPDNPLAEACLGTLKGYGIDTSRVLRTTSGRLGLYFVECGANQRPSQVVYDREGSAVSLTPPDAYDWPALFENAGWLHISGITPALSRTAAEASLAAVQHAKAAGCEVSCDLNFRKKLWRWDDKLEPAQLAYKTMQSLLPFVDCVIANEEDASDVLGIRAGASNAAAGQLEIDRYPQVAREIRRQFPNVSRVAITLRESVSASHNNWGAMLYDADTDTAHFAPLNSDGDYRPYEIHNIVDRVGGGDSFAGALIFALQDSGLQAPGTAIRFAVAASCLAHSISGDFNLVSRSEVESLMNGSASGRVVR